MKPFSAPFAVHNPLALKVLTLLGASAGFYAFGYDQGVANALAQNPAFQALFPALFESPAKQGATFGTFVLGAWLGTLIVSGIGNKMGRRSILQVASVLTLVFGALQAGSVNLPMFIVVRLINGVAVGALTSTVPAYVAELSRPEARGLMMALELVLASAGLMTAFIVTFAFRTVTGPLGWRLPLALQAIFIVVTIGALCFSPESPRYLMEVGRVADGRDVLRRLHGEQFAEKATEEILQAIALERTVARQGWLACFENNEQRFRRRTLLSLAANFFQQATGINMATYYAGAIFASLQLTASQGGLMIVGLGICGLVGTCIGCVFCIERLGRVKTMIFGSLGCSISQALLAAGAAHVDLKAGAIVAATGLFLFLAFFSGSWLPLGFVYPAEVTPLAIRTQAAPLGTSVQFIMNFFVVMITPVGISRIGYKFYIPFALSNAAMIPLLWIFFPEVAGLSLEEVDELFAGPAVIMRRSVHEKIGHRALDAALSSDKRDIMQIEKADV